MKWLFNKLLLVTLAALILAVIGPVARVYDAHLESYWLKKSLHHTLAFQVSVDDSDQFGTGSGVVVKLLREGKGCSLEVLTAYHVANRLGGAIDVPANVLLMDGTESEVLKEDKENDLSLLWFEDVRNCSGLRAAEVATQAPPVGGTIWVTGFPSRVLALSRGIYGGTNTQRFLSDSPNIQAAFSVSTGPGGSGGGVWYKGRLVSVIQDKANATHIALMAWGPSTKTLREFLEL